MRQFRRLLVVCLFAAPAFAETIPTQVPIAGEQTRATATDVAPPDPEDELTSDPHIREMMAVLWKSANLGQSCWERAAWIVRNEDGSFSCVQVPTTRECFQLKLSPERPEGAVALMHTHPSTLGVSRKDEGGDVKAAERIGLPLYTIGRSGVLRYDPVTNAQKEVAFGLSWLDEAARDSCDCAVQTEKEIRMARVRAAGRRNIQAAQRQTGTQ